MKIKCKIDKSNNHTTKVYYHSVITRHHYHIDEVENVIINSYDLIENDEVNTYDNIIVHIIVVH